MDNLLYERFLLEFEADLKKQCVVLMGLPAAGKSTFIKTDLLKYFPQMRGYSVTNSDAQVMAAQFNHAKSQYDWLKQYVKSPTDIYKFKESSKYVDNNGSMVVIPLTWEWWQENGNKGIKVYYKEFYKTFYATYFDIRDLAQASEQRLFQTKITKSGNMIIIDTTAANSKKVLSKLQDTHDNGFVNTIIYLDIDVRLSIQRDNWRKEHEGRGVGESVILSYPKKMDQALIDYKNNGNDLDGIVDRVLHFKWVPAGNHPVKGSWTQVSDDKYFLKRKLNQLKQKNLK